MINWRSYLIFAAISFSCNLNALGPTPITRTAHRAYLHAHMPHPQAAGSTATAMIWLAEALPAIIAAVGKGIVSCATALVAARNGNEPVSDIPLMRGDLGMVEQYTGRWFIYCSNRWRVVEALTEQDMRQLRTDINACIAQLEPAWGRARNGACVNGGTLSIEAGAKLYHECCTWDEYGEVIAYDMLREHQILNRIYEKRTAYEQRLKYAQEVYTREHAIVKQKQQRGSPGAQPTPTPGQGKGRAPGMPTADDGYTSPKRWDGKKVRAPKGQQYGYPDEEGKVWIPSGPDAHGGPHWDVQDPTGKTYDNVYPGGKIRPGKQ